MRKLNALLFFTFLCVPTLAKAIDWDLFDRLCLEEVVQIPVFIDDIPIPVGCEVVDCCPGCPGPGPIDWKILIDKNIDQNIKLNFKNLPKQQIQQLGILGAGKITENGEIILSAGETVLTNLPVQVDGQVPLGFFNAPEQSELDSSKSYKEADNERDEPMGINVQQYRGNFVVNRFRSRFILVPCNGRNRLEDKLELSNNIGNDSAIAVLDYRNAGCKNDQIVRVSSIASLGNLPPRSSCRSTVSVFSDDNAMSYEQDVNTWTSASGDVHQVDLAPVITVPVRVWLEDESFLVRAQNDFANANFLYNTNNTGIQFNPTYTVYEEDEEALDAIGDFCPSSTAEINDLRASDWYTANTLNIYYVDNAFTGVNCGQDRNVNYLGTTANLGSLPHEIGHAYGLRPSGNWGHTNGVTGFGNNNIMWGGGPGTRNQFTIGQSFRLNTDTTSMLNANGDRTGATETCLPDVNSIVCPALTLDSVPQ